MEEQEKQTEYMRGVPPHDETAESTMQSMEPTL